MKGLRIDIRKRIGDFTLETSFSCDGGVTGILGASGCGKSMTLKCIAGVMTPDEGVISLNGITLFDSKKGINLKPQERNTGLMFQNYALFPNMTVEENIRMGIRASVKEKAQQKRAVQEVIQKYMLSGLEKRKPGELSGGQQQRVALGRMMIARPQLLMFDEPFSALDEYLRWKMELELTDIFDEYEGSILFVSHNRDEIYRVCDNVIVMDHGRSSQITEVKSLFSNPESKAAALLSGCKNYSELEICDGHYYAKGWGIRIPFPFGDRNDNISVAGLRSHNIHPWKETMEQRDREIMIRTTVVKVIEDVFSMVIMVRPADAEIPELIRMEVPKDEWMEYQKERTADDCLLRVRLSDIMLLTK